jgi:hypothetical protein
MSDETKPQDSAEMPPASAGSQPAAWRVYADDGSETVHLFYEQARAAADEWNWSVEPLYRQPRPTLTDEEREALEASVRYWAGPFRPHPHAAVLRKLLERLK